MTTPKWLPNDEIKIVQCRECGTDIPVNASYPITAVDCHERYCPKDKAELDTPSY